MFKDYQYVKDSKTNTFTVHPMDTILPGFILLFMTIL